MSWTEPASSWWRCSDSLATPSVYEVSVGDRLLLGVSHPCTALDKWRLVPPVDRDGIVVDLIHVFA